MHKKFDWLILLVLSFLTVAFHLPSLDEPLDNDGGAVAYHARQIILGQPLYGTHHPAHHLPGIFYTFSLAFKLFGDNGVAPKILLLPWAIACAWLLFLLGRAYFDPLTGLLGAFFFTLLSSQLWLTGITPDMGHFANLPMTACIFLISIFANKKSPAWQYSGVGLLGVIAILYKAVFAAPLSVVVICILVMAWHDRGQKNFWKTAIPRLTYTTIGLVIPAIIVAAYFSSLGLLDRLLLVFKFSSNYFSDTNQMLFSWLPRPFGFPVYWLSINNVILLILGIIGAFHFLGDVISSFSNNWTKLILALWLVTSFAFAGIRGGGYPQYVVPCLPPLGLIAGAEISRMYQGWKKISPKKSVGVLVILILLVVGNGTILNYNLYKYYFSYKLGRISQQEYVYGSTIFGPRFTSMLAAANYINTHTKPNEPFYYWGLDVQIFYYANRNTSIDMLWPSYVSASGPPERVFSPLTKYIILDKPDALARPQWLISGLAQDYFLDTIIDGKEVYKRRAYQ